MALQEMNAPLSVGAADGKTFLFCNCAVVRELNSRTGSSSIVQLSKNTGMDGDIREMNGDIAEMEIYITEKPSDTAEKLIYIIKK